MKEVRSRESSSTIQSVSTNPLRNLKYHLSQMAKGILVAGFTLCGYGLRKYWLRRTALVENGSTQFDGDAVVIQKTRTDCGLVFWFTVGERQ